MAHSYTNPSSSSPARRLGAYVVIGFPQRLAIKDATATAPAASPDRPPLHNSIMIVTPSGHLEATYAKHHFFETDKSWATPGPEFTTVDLAFPESSPHFPTRDDPADVPTFRVCPAICMDVSAPLLSEPHSRLHEADTL